MTSTSLFLSTTEIHSPREPIGFVATLCLSLLFIFLVLYNKTSNCWCYQGRSHIHNWETLFVVIDFECWFSVLGKQSATDSLFCLADLSLLRSGEEQVLVPPNKSMGDIEELAASYERKLIEVSAGFFVFIYLLVCLYLVAIQISLKRDIIEIPFYSRARKVAAERPLRLTVNSCICHYVNPH